jgi:hypothetical protein
MSLLKFFECHEIEEEHLHCNKCKTMQPISNFGRDSGAKKLSSACKDCSKKLGLQTKNLLKITPLPPEDYTCPGCERTEKQVRDSLKYRGRKKHRVWSLDHNHDTGEFRGWICNKCNLALGNMNDDLEYARRLVKYLEKANG